MLKPDGSRVDDGELSAGSEPRTLAVGVSKLPNGTYTVAWHCVSKVDGHATAGAFAFGVGVNPSAPKVRAASGPGPNPLEMSGRWLFIIGVVAAFGGAVVALFAFPGARGVLRRFVLLGSLIGLAGVAVLALAQHGAARAPWSALLKTPIGHALSYRAIAMAVAILAVLLGARAVNHGLALVASGGAMYAEVVAGHAAATSSWIGGPSLEIAAQWVHFASAAIWMGGLAALLTAIRGAVADEKATAVRRYARFAAFALFVVAATGVYRAIGAIGSWSGLFHSGYGQIVIAKSVLLAGLAALGARQRFWNLERVGRDLGGLRRIGKAELVVATTIFVATAVLTGLSPPPPASAEDAPLTADGTDLGHTTRAHLEVTPGQAGVNTFTVRVTGIPAMSVTLRFAYQSSGQSGGTIGPSTLALHERKGTWTAQAANMSLDGRWSVTVVAQGRTTSAEISLAVATHCKVQTLAGPKGLVLYSQTLANGDSDTSYLDPGRPGRSEVHFTFFDAKGNELPIPTEPSFTAWRPGRSARELAVRRFSQGHFIAAGRFDRGPWRFEALAVPKGTDQPIRACFEQTI